MRRKFTVYGLRFSKTSFWNRINTGFLDPAVATVLTACGIETHSKKYPMVLWDFLKVATVLTACGIETSFCIFASTLISSKVATVLTACGIETTEILTPETPVTESCNSAYRLRY